MWKVGSLWNLLNPSFQMLKQSRRPGGFLFREVVKYRITKEEPCQDGVVRVFLLSQGHVFSLLPTEAILKKMIFLKALP